MKNLPIYKQLLKVTRLSDKRDPSYNTNKTMKVFSLISIALSAIFFIAITILILKKSPDTYEEAKPLLKIINVGLGAVLLYELFLKALMSLHKPTPSPFAFFILPIAKYKVILFRQLYTAISKMAIILSLFLLPFMATTAFVYKGTKGVIESIILLLLFWVLNKQIFDFAFNAFKKYKITVLIVVASYILIMLSPLLTVKSDILSEAVLYVFISVQ